MHLIELIRDSSSLPRHLGIHGRLTSACAKNHLSPKSNWIMPLGVYQPVYRERIEIIHLRVTQRDDPRHGVRRSCRQRFFSPVIISFATYLRVARSKWLMEDWKLPRRRSRLYLRARWIYLANCLALYTTPRVQTSPVSSLKFTWRDRSLCPRICTRLFSLLTLLLHVSVCPSISDLRWSELYLPPRYFRRRRKL